MAQRGVNTAVIGGNLVRDSELKYTNSGLAICEFSVAVNDRRKQGDDWVDEVSYFDVTLFGRSGEAIQRYLTKGKQVVVEGKLRQDRWQDRESGQNRSKVVLIANNVFLGGSAGGGDGGGSRGGPAGGTQPNRGSAGQSGGQRPSGGADFGDDDFPDGIPF